MTGAARMSEALHDIRRPIYVVKSDGEFAFGVGGTAVLGADAASEEEKGASADGRWPVVGYVPACGLEDLGDPSLCADHGIRYPYLSGSMATGISSVEIVAEMGRRGCLGFFGAAGLAPAEVEAAIDRISRELGPLPYGFNLIHSPAEPDLEAGIVDLYIRKGVRLVEAAAFLDLTLPVVRYRVHGIHRDAAGEVVAPNRIIAKASRVEVASKFFAPPPQQLLRELAAAGGISPEQARMAEEIPMAQDLTAEADSAGHTDNRSLVDLLPTMTALRDRMQARHRFKSRLRVGAAGGIGTPAAAAAAFSMGAAYVLVGSVNQACVEAGTSDAVREMLAQAGQADTAMAPAADMFEMGVKVQVLRRGTMFAMRAARLYETYRAYDGIEAIPAAERKRLEAELFRASLDDVWARTREYFHERDPEQVSLAERDPKHRMALVFRWYLGRASRWATAGELARRIDYQVWCGPAMGAFNEWTKGTFLADRRGRKVSVVAMNILFGAAVQMRLIMLRNQGVALPDEAARIRPLEPRVLEEYLG
ncbi:MAG: PfaD family polyunsaturated fatty acid/polyketide biosynthesis protein [Elusimicrobiota bacterium]